MTHHDKARELVQRQRQIASLHRGFCASETDTIRGPAIMSFGEHARLAADADAAADLIAALAEENQRLREARALAAVLMEAADKAEGGEA